MNGEAINIMVANTAIAVSNMNNIPRDQPLPVWAQWSFFIIIASLMAALVWLVFVDLEALDNLLRWYRERKDG